MSEKLGLASRPLLASDATISVTDAGAVVETDDMVYTFEGESARVLTAVKDRLDGTVRLADLASESGLPPEHLRATLDALAGDDVVLDVGTALELTSAEDFLARYQRLCRSWVKEMFATPFWEKLHAGEASRALVFGWGIEFYHYTEAANEHMAAAAANCREDHIARRWLAQHYVDEQNHGLLFAKGLARCALDPEQVRRAPPLASTRALINFLYELACTDSLAYAGTFGIMHSEPKTLGREEITSYYDGLSARYGFAQGLFEAIKEHALIDTHMDHGDLVIERMVRRDETVSPDAARRVLRAARGTAEHFVLFFEGISDYYGVPGASLPRRPLDARWFRP